jgi:hypothetical protein
VRIDCEVVNFKDIENTGQRRTMRVPIIGKDSDIINIYVNFIEVTKEVLHYFLRNVWGLRYTHGKAIVLIIAKRHTNSAQLLAGIIQFKGIVLHGNIQLSKIFKSIPSL